MVIDMVVGVLSSDELVLESILGQELVSMLLVLISANRLAAENSWRWTSGEFDDSWDRSMGSTDVT